MGDFFSKLIFFNYFRIAYEDFGTLNLKVKMILILTRWHPLMVVQEHSFIRNDFSDQAEGVEVVLMAN